MYVWRKLVKGVTYEAREELGQLTWIDKVLRFLRII